MKDNQDPSKVGPVTKDKPANPAVKPNTAKSGKIYGNWHTPAPNARIRNVKH